ncbi:MAG: twin-arginine translocase subunit TatC [Planctomycetaceae bacterium]|nr:twin-arginine translocase subunit TatC [Planctomycetaceae bacterium]
MPQSRDLFDETTMSFGEHLEVLRVHLWKALIGLALGVGVALFFGQQIIAVIRSPIDQALQDHGYNEEKIEDNLEGFDFWGTVKDYFSETEENLQEPNDSGTPLVPDHQDEVTSQAEKIDQAREDRTIKVQIRASELAAALHQLNPEAYPQTPAKAVEDMVTLRLESPYFARWTETSISAKKPVTLNVQEAFLTYLKVSFISGLVLASPWVFFQLWMFVAAGLYPHEQRYIYMYLPVSLTLFLGGAVFCFFLVFPFVLEFLLGFNKMLGVQPQIRLSEWISFAITLPVMFGLSFQLPLVMLFLERISIFKASDYREKRRMSILVISIVSMLFTPADPMSMIMMMIPLLLLYELGIIFCGISPVQRPFAEDFEA